MDCTGLYWETIRFVQQEGKRHSYSQDKSDIFSVFCDLRTDMTEHKEASPATAAPPSEQSQSITTKPQDSKSAKITLAHRGTAADEDVIGETDEDANLRNRTLLSAKEEKALLRRIDWRIMTVCSLLFLLKNIDADNISNARIMNRGTDRNIMTELNMTSDQYNLLNVLYYVRLSYHSLRSKLFADYSHRCRTSYLRPLPTCYSRSSSPVFGSQGS